MWYETIKMRKNSIFVGPIVRLQCSMEEFSLKQTEVYDGCYGPKPNTHRLRQQQQHHRENRNKNKSNDEDAWIGHVLYIVCVSCRLSSSVYLVIAMVLDLEQRENNL